jgi:hypothetical protein
MRKIAVFREGEAFSSRGPAWNPPSAPVRGASPSVPIPAILLACPPDPPLELIQYRFDRAIQGHGSIERMVALRSGPSIQQLDSAWRLDGGIRANANSQPLSPDYQGHPAAPCVRQILFTARNVEVGRSWGDEDERCTQIMLKRIWGCQYQYTGHCCTFMQNNVRFIDTLPCRDRRCSSPAKASFESRCLIPTSV